MKRLWQIARMGLWLGGTVFGGIAVAYPAIREQAPQLGVRPEEVDGLYALAVFLPGPSFLNLWGAVALRAAGVAGAVVAMFTLMLPASILVLGLPLLTRFAYLGAHAAGALQGGIWATAGLLMAAAIENTRKLTERRMQVLAFLGVVSVLMGLHPLLLMVIMLALGGLMGYVEMQRKVA